MSDLTPAPDTADAVTQAPAPETPAQVPAQTPPAPVPQQQPEQAAPQAQQPVETQQAPQGAPESYQPFEVPDGLPVNEGLMGEFTALAKELNLSQEAAQRLVNLQAQAALQDRQEWSQASRADAEFGGPGLQGNLEIALRAVDAFGTPELKQLLIQTGLGDHPEIIRAFYRAGKALGPDHIVYGGAGNTPAERGLAERLYDKQ